MRMLQRLLPAVGAFLCVILAVLLAVDAIWPLANIFLNEFVKWLLLVTCLVSASCGVMRIARQRRRDSYHRRMR